MIMMISEVDTLSLSFQWKVIRSKNESVENTFYKVFFTIMVANEYTYIQKRITYYEYIRYIVIELRSSYLFCCPATRAATFIFNDLFCMSLVAPRAWY